MLHHLGNVFFVTESIDRKPNHTVPTVNLTIYNRTTRQIIGALRFNHDPNYSKNSKEIRMQFDAFDPKDLDPCASSILEDIIVGGFVWITRDNHYTYDFHPRPYMVVHNYDEDPDLMKIINAKTIQILKDLKCKKGDADENMYIFSKEFTSPYLSEKLARNH
jgi:hypothetical protein